MSRKYNINNLEDLHQQVRLLKAEYRFKGDALVGDSKKYLHQFTLGAFIKKYATPSAFLKIDDKFNISSKVMSLILPLVMNSTFFKGSGIVTKALVGLASGKVGKSLDAEHLSAIFNSVRSWFSKSKKKKETDPLDVDYGIPPDSETY
ncbi:hypothetical protein [Pedobacter steynii]|uniref:Uncharacterized protein n=1 Tax=Pedobacter steynii TaxID=430522 RepID=A0A1D7QDD7_9SPHI|nr:hypothetical protein [Pedobacter steynii]AOM76681.1 hypothetical protein BFS30_05605 [Pedobacter steynii]